MSVSRALVLVGLTLLASETLRAAPKTSKKPASFKKAVSKPQELAPFDLSTLPQPAPLAVATPTPLPTPTSAPLPEFPAPLPPSIEEKRAELPTGGVLPPDVPSQAPVPVVTPIPIETAEEDEAPAATEVPAASPSAANTNVTDAWNAAFNVAGLLAQVKPNQAVTLSFWALNRGSVTWQTGATGANRVRLVARWVDASTYKRRKWNFFWLQSPMAPDAQARRDFSITAPPQAGSYYVVFGLIRLPASGEYTPPGYGASQKLWPNEFANIAFQVEVAP